MTTEQTDPEQTDAAQSGTAQPPTLPGDRTGTFSGAFVEHLGLAFTEVTPDRVTGRLPLGPHLHQPYGIVHGGVYCSVVETLASVAAATWLGADGKVVGVNNNTDFYRAISEGELVCTATPLHRGRSQQVWVVELRDEQERLVARGQVRLQNLRAGA